MRFSALLFLLGVAGTTFADEPVSLFANPDAFETLVNPECSHCRIEATRRERELRDDDRVLCWIRGYSDGGAIPIRFFLNTYRVISDSYGVFVYDPDAGFARGFAPSYDFTFHGWRNGVMVMKHKDGTLYSSLTGKAFEGPNAGAKLEAVPTLVSNWGYWMKQYPETVAYHMFDKYQPKELPEKELEASLKTRGPLDRRLPASEIVLGVASDNKARAYRLDDLGKLGIIYDKIGDQDLVILWNAATKTAAAYESTAHSPNKALSPRSVRLRSEAADSLAPFVDEETKSHWDIAGRATDGEHKGWTLRWLDGTQVKWFAWAAEYPETSIYQADEKPRITIEFTEDSLEVVKEYVLKNKAVLVDVRSQEEWNEGHIEGSIFLPVTSLRKGGDPKEIAKKLPKKKILYTFCVVGMRAKAAAKTLQQHGYTVRALKPGYDELIEAGFTKGKNKKQSEKSAAKNENTRQRNAG